MSLPTGEGKSLCYASLLFAFDWIKECHIRKTTSETLCSSIVLVVSPLTALIRWRAFEVRSEKHTCIIAKLCNFFTTLQFRSALLASGPSSLEFV